MSPRPSDPNSGLTTTSPPSLLRTPLRAPAADSPTHVLGTGRPASSSFASARYLSTAASTALGGFSTGTPFASRRWSASIRKTTCSRLPGGIIRTSTPSTAPRSTSPASTRLDSPSTRPTTRLKAMASSFTSTSFDALARSWTCQPRPETSATRCFIPADARRTTGPGPRRRPGRRRATGPSRRSGRPPRRG